MAKVYVASDDSKHFAEILTNDEGFTEYVCKTCGESDSDRGHFEDTVELASRHVDTKH